MACYKPLIRFYVPDDHEASGHVYTLRRFAIERAKNPDLTYEDLIYRKDVMLIPCGQCIGCRIRKREDWACRIEMEAMTSKPHSVWFVTLTYDDKNIPGVNHETGEVIRGALYKKQKENLKENQTLWYEDIQKFLKRLRKTSEQNIRYFCAGEYGEKTGRPHYHLILFNYNPEKLEPYRLLSKEGYYTDTRITKCWPYGIHNMSEPTSNKAFSYTAGYVTKKIGNETMEHIKRGLRPPFAMMSLKPGLGEKYYLENKERIWEQGYIQLSNGKRAAIPRYFEKQMEAENPKKLWEIKRQRQQKSMDSTKNKMEQTDIKLESYLSAQERKIHKFRKSSGTM